MCHVVCLDVWGLYIFLESTCLLLKIRDVSRAGGGRLASSGRCSRAPPVILSVFVSVAHCSHCASHFCLSVCLLLLLCVGVSLCVGVFVRVSVSVCVCHVAIRAVTFDHRWQMECER